MTEMVKGTKVSFTDSDGVTRSGAVDMHRRGWVVVDLDEPCDTNQGWKASKLMVRASLIIGGEG